MIEILKEVKVLTKG